MTFNIHTLMQTRAASGLPCNDTEQTVFDVNLCKSKNQIEEPL